MSVFRFCSLSRLLCNWKIQARATSIPMTMIDIESYPHFAEAIVASASPEVLLALRGVSHWFRHLANSRLLSHLSHEIGTDTTTILTPERSLRIDLWALSPDQLRYVRTLELRLGAYDDPNRIRSRLEDLPDTARPLPHLPALERVLIHDNHDTVIRHVLQETDVPSVIAPVRRRGGDLVDDIFPPPAQFGACLPTDRVIVPLAVYPWDMRLDFNVFVERRRRIDIVLFPPLLPPPAPALPTEREWPTYMSLVEGAASQSGGTAPWPSGEMVLYADVPAEITFVGFETWDKVVPHATGVRWEDRIRGLCPVGVAWHLWRESEAGRVPTETVAMQMERIRFKTLQEWREENVSELEWELIAKCDLA